MGGEHAPDDREPTPDDREPTPDGAAPGQTDDEKVAEILAAIRGGNASAYGGLVELFQGRLMSFVVGVLKDYETAQEVTQEAFVRAHRYLDRFDDRRRFYPWLAQIAFRLAQDHWARQRRDRELRERYGAFATEDHSREDPLQAAIADEESRRLWEAVRRLPGGERAAVLLFYRQELSVREVARVLGVSSGTVKTFLFRARRHLRQTLGADAPAAAGNKHDDL